MRPIEIDFKIARLIDKKNARQYLVLPIKYEGQSTLIAMVEPENQRSLQFIQNKLGGKIRRAHVSREEFFRVIEKIYPPIPPVQKRPGILPIGQLMLESKLINKIELIRALQVQKTSGGRLGQVVVSMGLINRLALAKLLAEQSKLPFVDLRKTPPDPQVVKMLDPEIARQYACIPFAKDKKFLQVAITDPTDNSLKERIREHLKSPLKFFVTSEFDIEWVLRSIYRDTFLDESIWGLFYRSPEESAYITFTNSQLITIIVILGLLITGLYLNPAATLIGLNFFFAILYFIISLFRIWLSFRGASEKQDILIADEEIHDLNTEDLPIYTILVPVFREESVLPQLVESIQKLDYPKNKLDVKLLLEESDTGTLEMAKRIKPPGFIEFVVVPDSIPRTKPKACNFGLIAARGKFLVIYDAEDKPESDQLKRAVLAFEKGGEQLICVQARLNYYNRNQNLLTRWFTTEYSNWFDLVLPGLDRERFPIPLGGTSNHFLTEKLREIGGWDPFNVTEDADLGVRMYKYGYKTAIMNSTTYEEANSEIMNWIRQRTRWIKGYMQTWLVHMRYPLKLYKELGFRGFLGYHLTIGGTPLLFVINPIFWVLTTLWFLFHLELLQALFPPVIYFVSSINLFFGNFIFLYLNLVSSFQRKYYDLGRYALLSPLYWVLMSVASWRAFVQLINKPFYWEKTIHGLHYKNENTTLSG